MSRVFVISDLHLGGRPDARDAERKITRVGFQICNAYRDLVSFIDWLAPGNAVPQGEGYELVINGDIVDILAEDDYSDPAIGPQAWTSNERHAIEKVKRIAERTREGQATESRGVFEALGDLLRRGGGLTILLGNHDIELALPRVRKYLVDLLGGPAAQLRLIYDGEAYTNGRMLIEHGNRYDPWNVVDHSRLRQERSVRSRGLLIDEGVRARRYFVPPAGTQVVVRFMNRIKRAYRFVDLLKPEDAAVIPILLTLAPDRKGVLGEILRVATIVSTRRSHRLAEPTRPRVSGDLARDVLRESHQLEDVLREVLGKDASLFLEEDPETEAVSATGDLGPSEWIRDASDWLAENLEPWKEGAESARAWAALALERGNTDKRLRQLHAALRLFSRHDRAFVLDSEQSTYVDAARDLAEAGEFDVVVFGHTHLPKSIDLTLDSGRTIRYLNTGTWCDVMRVPSNALKEELVEAKTHLAEFLRALRDNEYGPFVQRYLSFAEIQTAGGHAQGQLFSYCGIGRERSPPLTSAL